MTKFIQMIGRGFRRGPSRRDLLEALAEAKDEAAMHKESYKEAEDDVEEYQGFLDRLDTQISNALKAAGEFPSKPAGCPDRIDVACELIQEVGRLRAEAATHWASAQALELELKAVREESQRRQAIISRHREVIGVLYSCLNLNAPLIASRSESHGNRVARALAFGESILIPIESITEANDQP